MTPIKKSSKSSSTGKKSTKKTTLSVVGTKQAVEGYRFFYRGPLSECKACKVRNICFGLTPGRLYEVRGVRDRTHDCGIFAENARVVEVEEASIDLVIDAKKSMEGSVIGLENINCRHLECASYDLCKPNHVEIKPGDKFKIVSVKGEVECPDNKERVQVKVMAAD